MANPTQEGVLLDSSNKESVIIHEKVTYGLTTRYQQTIKPIGLGSNEGEVFTIEVSMIPSVENIERVITARNCGEKVKLMENINNLPSQVLDYLLQQTTDWRKLISREES